MVHVFTLGGICMFSLVNKHEEFFDYLVLNAQNFHKSVLLAKEVLQDISTLERNGREATKLEHAGNKITIDIVARMKKVFITPIDREDFYLLTRRLDDCLDDVKDVVLSLRIYHASASWDEPIKVVEILEKMAVQLVEVMRLLKDIDKNEKEIAQCTRVINQLESEADVIYRGAISELFDGTYEIIDIIRWKEIMEGLETTANQVENVGNLIKEVVMKYA